MYPKNKILQYEGFSEYRDILTVLLDDEGTYTVPEVQGILNEFLEREVD